MTYVSTRERLKDLPEVFTLNTAAAMIGVDTVVASTYIARWKKQGLVSSLGQRTGVHFNLGRNPEAAELMRLDAIAYVYPGSMIGGVSALHRAGWTTQIPREMDLMVPFRRSYPAIEDVQIHGRPLSWVKAARAWRDSTTPLPLLAPAFALADCVGNSIWCPDPDDLEWDQLDLEDLRRAFACLDVQIPEAWSEEIEYIDGTRPEY